MEVPLEKNPESSAWNPQSEFLSKLDSLTQGQLSRRPLKNNGRKDEQCSQIRYVIISIKGVFRYRWLSCIQSFRIYHKNIRFLDRIKIIHLNLVPRSHSVLHFPLAVGDLGTRLNSPLSGAYMPRWWIIWINNRYFDFSSEKETP